MNIEDQGMDFKAKSTTFLFWWSDLFFWFEFC